MLKIATLCLLFVGASYAGELCSLCESAIEDVIQKADGDASQAVQILDEKVCSRLSGVLVGVCDAAVKYGVGALMNDIGNGQTSAQVLCSDIHLCGAGLDEIEIAPIASYGALCGLCETAVADVIKYADGDEAKAVSILEEKVCSKESGFLQSACDMLVKFGVGALMKDLGNGQTDATMLCNDVHLCSSSVPEEEVFNTAVLAGGSMCGICEAAIGSVIQAANGDASKLIPLLDSKICSQVPASVQGICDMAVKYAVGTLEKDIGNGQMSAAQLCADIHLCSASAPEDFFPDVLSGSPLCGLCEQAVEGIVADADKDETKIEDLLDSRVCGKLGSSLQGICDMAVKFGIGDLMNSIGNGDKDATMLCTRVHLCSSSIVEEETPAMPNICKACENVVSKLDSEASNIESVAAAYCKKSRIPAFVCQKFVKGLIPLIHKFGANADAVCEKLPGCQSSVENFAVKSNPTLCEYCEEAIGVVKNLVESKVPTIVDDLKVLCNKLPSSESGICSSLIDQYGTMLLEKLLGFLNPEQVCNGIHLCSSAIADQEISPAQADALQALANPDGVNWDPVECNFCKMVFNFVQNNFMSTDFINALLMDIAKACKDLKSDKTQQECLNIIGTYGDMILNYAKSLISPDHICPMIKMCPASA